MTKRLFALLIRFSLLGAFLAGCTAPAATIAPTAIADTPTTLADTTTQPAAASPTALPTATLVPTQAPTPAPTLSPTLEDVPGVSGEASMGDPYAPELGNTGYDVQRYTLRLSMNPAEQSLRGQVLIEATSTLDNLRRLSLDFIGFEVESVTTRGEILFFERQDGKVWVDLPSPLPAGEDFALTVTYGGSPTQEASKYVPFISNLGMQFAAPDQMYVVSEPDGARYWFPCNDHPRDKATYRFEIAVPEGLVAVANGEMLETQTGIEPDFAPGASQDLYIWEHNYPLATSLAMVAVGPYVRVESVSPGGVKLRSYVFAEEQAAFEALQPTIGEMIDWLSEMFGPYPFEAFGYVSAANMPGALETQTMVVIGTDSLTSEGTLVHEMSHMWFGDWVSLNLWADIWRNEGFATYITEMWFARNNPAALDPAIQQYEQMMAGNFDYPLGNPPKADMFGAASYLQGAVVAHALRQETGDEAFFAGLKTYFETYAGGDASLEQFRAALEAASGKPLGDFFAQWLE